MAEETQGLLQALEQRLDAVVKEIYRCMELLDEITNTIKECHEEIEGTDKGKEGMDMSLLRPRVEGSQ